MVYSAEYIKKKLEQEMILSQAFGRDLVSVIICHALNMHIVDIRERNYIIFPQTAKVF